MQTKELYNKQLKQFLSEFVLNERLELFNKVVNNRTRYITVVLENIFQAQNASAVLRSSEIYGIQDVYAIENHNEFKIDKEVAMGSSKWLNIYNFNKHKNNTLETIDNLKNKGYRIVATTPHKNDVTLDTFDLQKGKFALFFGSELPGLSQIVLDNADEYLKIPMFGFTESFNISVSAAIILHHFTNKIRTTEIGWQLSESEKDEILVTWLKNSIKMSKQLVKEFDKKYNFPKE